MSVGISIVVTIILVLVNGYFSMSEMALVNAKQILLQKEAAEGDKRAARALDLATDSGQFLATIQVAITLVGFFASAAAATSLSDPLCQFLSSFNIGWLSFIAPALSPIVITLIVSYLSIVVGELVPKRMALADAESISKKVAGPLRAFSKIAAPLVWLTSASANGLSRLLGVKEADDRQQVSEEEIKYMVKDNVELADDEKRLIHEIFDLGDMTVREIMKPRVDVIFAEDTETVRDVIERMRGTGFSRIPVFHETQDRVVGIAYFKDLLEPLLNDKEEDLVSEYLFEPIFVPETKDVLPLLSDMQMSHQQMAVVLDEYGGTAGIATIEDVVEEIVGEIIDESDNEAQFINRLSDDEWLVDGRFPVEQAITLGWPVEESDEYETIAGWLMDTVDVVPQLGDEFSIGTYQFAVEKMRRHRITRLRVKKLN
jgi:putative hemolysin